MAVKSAVVSAASSGSNEIVAAVTGVDYSVLSYVLVADAAVTAKWQGDSTDRTGAMSFAANGGVSAPYNPEGHFKAGKSKALNLNLGGAVGVRGHVTYRELR